MMEGNNVVHEGSAMTEAQSQDDSVSINLPSFAGMMENDELTAETATLNNNNGGSLKVMMSDVMQAIKALNMTDSLKQTLDKCKVAAHAVFTKYIAKHIRDDAFQLPLLNDNFILALEIMDDTAAKQIKVEKHIFNKKIT